MNIACTLITHFPIKAELRRHSELHKKPVIITTQPSQGPLVLDNSIEASGVAAGMPLQEALSRCKGASLLEADVPHYLRVFDRIIEALFQVSVGRQRKWDTRGGRKTREIWGGVSSLDEVEYFR